MRELKNYNIGLDIGINNVGWSILNNDTGKVEHFGVRLFSPSASAADRRVTRNVRRRMKRKDTRVNDLLRLMDSIKFPSSISIDPLLIEKRYFGISKQIEKQDIVNILSYLVSHRGYIPYGDEEPNIISLNGKLPCEYYYQLFKETGKYRDLKENVSYKDNQKEIETLLEKQFEYYPELNENIVSEVIKIFVRKRQYWEGPGSINSLTKFGRFKTEQDVKDYELNKSQDSDYEKYIYEDLIGRCEIYPNEKTAPKLNYYSELFNLLNDFINISFTDIDDTNKNEYFYLSEKTKDYKLNTKGLEEVIDYCYNYEKSILKYDSLFKNIFNISIEKVKGYRIDKQMRPEFSTFNFWRIIKKEFDTNEIDCSILSDIDLYNRVMYIFTTVPGTVELERQLSGIKDKYNLSNEFIDCLKNSFRSFKKKSPSPLTYHSLSEKALIIASELMLKEAKNFMQVKNEYKLDKEKKDEIIAKYEKLNNGKAYINPIFIDDIIASPQVKKSLRQSMKVINEIIKVTGEFPKTIAIESTAEVNGDEKRKEIQLTQKLQEKLRKEAISNLEAINAEVSESNIRKMMCYIEMNGHCAYTNAPIKFHEAAIEHILPISKSFDNSIDNITISIKSVNDEKGNKTPYQYLSSKNQYEDFKNRVLNNKNLSQKKKENLLFEGDLNKYEKRFFNRNLRDTAYATKELVNQINNFNEYLKSINKDVRINTLSTPGQITSLVRRRMKLEKDRDDGKYHHAVDAGIVAAITQTPIGKKMIYAQNNEQFWVKFKEETKTLHKDLEEVVIYKNEEELKNVDSDDKIRISSQINKDPQKSLSNANVIKIIKNDEKYFKIKQINNIYEIKNYGNGKSDFELLTKLLDPSDNTKKLLIQDNHPKLFNKLVEIFNKYKDENEKENPFVLYLKDKHGLEINETIDYNKLGIRSSDKIGAPLVNKLRYMETINDPYLLEKKTIKKKDSALIGLEGLSQVCTRVYKDLDNNKFIFLPIYSISVNLETGKVKENDKYYKMYYDKYINNKNVKFIVDLYNNDLVNIIKGKGHKVSGFILGFDKESSRIRLKNGESFRLSDKSLTVYDVDILGNKKIRLTVEL